MMMMVLLVTVVVVVVVVVTEGNEKRKVKSMSFFFIVCYTSAVSSSFYIFLYILVCALFLVSFTVLPLYMCRPLYSRYGSPFVVQRQCFYAPPHFDELSCVRVDDISMARSRCHGYAYNGIYYLTVCRKETQLSVLTFTDNPGT